MSEIWSQITGLKISGGKNIFWSKSNSKLKTSSCQRGRGIAQPPSHGRVSAASAGTEAKTVAPLNCNNKSNLHLLPIQAPFRSFTCPWFSTTPPTQKGGVQASGAFHTASSLPLQLAEELLWSAGWKRYLSKAWIVTLPTDTYNISTAQIWAMKNISQG